MDLQASLKQHFGFNQFRLGQHQVIEAVMAGHSSLAVFSTGSGKSLCFQLPALLLPGLTVVVSPLIALMKDQVDFLNEKGIGAARLDSTMSFSEIDQAVVGMKQGRVKIVYLSPEKLASHRWQNLFSSLQISLMVIDEVHCISEWGHNFRPDYMKLERISKLIGAECVLGLTATATASVIKDIEQCFEIEPRFSFIGEFFRPELAMNFSVCDEQVKLVRLAELIKSRPAGPCLVYVTLQKTAEQVATYLAEQGLPAVYYHAGLRPDIRAQIQNQFMGATHQIVVATIAFGMGVDKSDIRYVYHYNLPKSLENYIQETGRAGRDRGASICEVLASPEDVTVLKNFIYGDTPEPAAIRSFLNYLSSHRVDSQRRAEIDVSIYELSNMFNIRPLVLNTFIAYLELDGVLKGEGRYFSGYKITFVKSQAEILQSFDTKRADFLEKIFLCGKMGRSLLSLDVPGVSPDRINQAINYLEDKGFIKTKVAGLRHCFSFVDPNIDMNELLQRSYTRFIDREAREIVRIDRVGELIAYQGCKTSFLLNYFGRPQMENCRVCSWCKTGRQTTFSQQVSPVLGATEQSQILEVKKMASGALLTDRSVACYLCGISSPSMARAKVQTATGLVTLSKHPLFGALSGIPFESVLKFCMATGH